jgi:DNA-binding NtrC family response regulator
MIQDAVSRNRTGTLTLQHFTKWLDKQTPSFQTNTNQAPATDTLLTGTQTEHLATLEQATRQLVVVTLEQCHGNQSEAARISGISRQRLARILANTPAR